MEHIIHQNGDTAFYWDNLEKAFYEKQALESFILFIVQNTVNCDLRDYYRRYIEVIENYDRACAAFENKVIYPETDGKGGAWNANFVEKFVTVSTD